MEVENVRFSVLSSEDILRLSVREIDQHSLYSKNVPNSRAPNSLYLGTTDNRFICGTCKKSCDVCTGHVGHIELSRALFHPLFNNLTLKVLRSVCFWCSALLKKPKKKATSVREHLTALCGTVKSSVKCPQCEGRQPRYTKSGPAILLRWDGETKFDSPEEEETALESFTAEKAYNILKFISEDDAEIMGITCPAALIMRHMIVPPVLMRPSVSKISGGKTRGQDDLTLKLVDIIRTNTRLREAPNDSGLLDMLQGHVCTYMDKEPRGSFAVSKKKAGGRSSNIKSIVARISGKKGRLRANMMGKRVNFSSRAVVGPAPGYDIDTIGVPRSVCRTQTIPVRVNRLNLTKIRALVEKGDAWAVDTGNRRIVLQQKNKKPRRKISIRENMVVHRYLRDGDWVVFNRQPSLHKESMMGHKVKVVNGDTFRLSLACTTPYNADFDGDEMNLHVPQSEQAKAEVALLMNVANQIVSPQKNGPCISLVQDSVLGLYKLTQADSTLDQDLFSDCLMEIKYPRKLNIKSMKHCKGRDLISAVVPAELNVLPYCTNGQITGVVDKKGIKKMVHVVFLDYGPQTCMEFISDLQRIITRFLTFEAFSVGFGDCFVDAGQPPPSGSTFDECGRYVKKNISADNAMLKMAEAGSKGALVNIVQITTCVGQQYVEGEPIKNGFVSNSFVNGLNPREFFVHAQGGREGLVDTAVKTASTGYIQRRLVKLMESQRVCFDGAVRNSMQQVVQFQYGGDGLDATYLENSEGFVVPFDLKRLLQNHAGPNKLPKNFLRRLKALCDDILQPNVALPQKNAIDKTLAAFKKRKITPRIADVQNLLNDCTRRLRRAIAQPGTMVGALAATSLGEPVSKIFKL